MRKTRNAKQYRRAWFVGSRQERGALTKDMAAKQPDVVWGGGDLQGLNEAQWKSIVCT